MLKRTYLIAFAMLFAAGAAHARDNLLNMPIQNGLETPDARERLDGSVQFHFGDAHPEVDEELGEVRSNERTRAFNRSDSEACNWVLLSALLDFQKVAQDRGGNAVINIRSNWKNNVTSSDETFVCAKGGIMAGVALIGEVVRLK